MTLVKSNPMFQKAVIDAAVDALVSAFLGQTGKDPDCGPKERSGFAQRCLLTDHNHITVETKVYIRPREEDE